MLTTGYPSLFRLIFKPFGAIRLQARYWRYPSNRASFAINGEKRPPWSHSQGRNGLLGYYYTHLTCGFGRLLDFAATPSAT